MTTTVLPVLDIEREIAQQGIPQSWQATYRKALGGNRPAATKAMCGMCQGWEDGARKAIRECADLGCPNHAVRPFQKKAGADSAIEVDYDSDTEEISDLPRTETSGTPTLEGAKAAILDHLHRKGESQRGYIIFSTGIPESLWSEAIKALLAEGEVVREGEKRSTRYRLKE